MPNKKLDFKAGQYVVYPTQGVGKLLRIEEQCVAGQKIKMLVIDFERNHMTLRVPIERAEISGLRPLTSAKKMDEAIASAKGKAGAKRMIWARRAAQYEENIFYLIRGCIQIQFMQHSKLLGHTFQRPQIQLTRRKGHRIRSTTSL